MKMYERRYLNREEKKQVLIIGAFHTYLKDNIPEWIKLGHTNQFMKLARMTSTYARKLMNEFFANKDEDQVRLCLNMAKDEAVITKNNSQAWKEYEDAQKRNEYVLIKRDDYDKITEQAVTICQTCKCDEKYAESCELRHVLMETDVAAANWGEGICQYKYLDDESEDK